MKKAIVICTCSRCQQLKSTAVYPSRPNGYCIDCQKQYLQQWRNLNKEKVRAHDKKWKKNNPERKKEADKNWLIRNPAQKAVKLKRCRDFYYANKAHCIDRIKAWRLANPEKAKVIARSVGMRYKAACKSRCPSWLTNEDHVVMRGFYAVARMYERENGAAWEVDHKVPLQGKLVSGLHVPWNLRVVRRPENRMKSNKFEIL